jgi:transcriptional regulator with XRE-family HTH domain
MIIDVIPVEKRMNDAVVSVLNRRVGAVVRAKRIDKNMSQLQLANAVHLSRTSVAHIELGKQECGLQTFVRLSEALGIASYELLRQATGEPNLDDAWVIKVLQRR